MVSEFASRGVLNKTTRHILVDNMKKKKMKFVHPLSKEKNIFCGRRR